jgi:hypothetical protein
MEASIVGFVAVEGVAAAFFRVSLFAVLVVGILLLIDFALPDPIVRWDPIVRNA